MNCTGLFGQLLGHNFKARYDETPPESPYMERGSLYAFKEAVRVLTKYTYRCDVCTRCGQVINREPK